MVAGAVLASGGTLTVITRNKRIELRPERDGTTTVVSVKPVKRPVGTRIEIGFGPGSALRRHTAHWAGDRAHLSATGKTYSGKTSPWWYDVAQFHELLAASPDTRPVRELVAELDGCTGAKAGEIVAAASLQPRALQGCDPAQAAQLLGCARLHAKPVNPKRLGAVGLSFPDDAYAVHAALSISVQSDELRRTSRSWSKPGRHVEDDRSNLSAYVNRTPVTGNIRAARDKRDIDCLRLRPAPHRRQDTEGCAVRHLAQHHHAVHADHL